MINDCRSDVKRNEWNHLFLFSLGCGEKHSMPLHDSADPNHISSFSPLWSTFGFHRMLFFVVINVWYQNCFFPLIQSCKHKYKIIDYCTYANVVLTKSLCHIGWVRRVVPLLSLFWLSTLSVNNNHKATSKGLGRKKCNLFSFFLIANVQKYLNCDCELQFWNKNNNNKIDFIKPI